MNRPTAFLWLAALSAVACPTAHASVVTPARDSIATLSFLSQDFSDARMVINATQTIGAGSSGSKSVVFDAFPQLESYALSSSGAVGVTLNTFTPPASFDLTVSAAGAGTWSIAERFSATDDLTSDALLYRYSDNNDKYVPFTHNQLPALELFLGIGGLVDDGGSFGVGFTIPGDWSTTGGLDSTTHQYFLANLDGEWLVDTPFVFDPVANLTRFHATNPNYEGVASEDPSPFLDVYFLGQAVVPVGIPEPEGWTMLVGFGALGFVLRRRGRGAEANVASA